MSKMVVEKTGADGKKSTTTVEVSVGLTREMKSVLKVAKFEIVRQLKKPAFWVAMLLMPAIIGLVVLISAVNEEHEMMMPVLNEDTVVAIVDEAGILPEGSEIGTVCASQDVCIEKVKSGEVDLYYHLPADFAERGVAEFYHVTEGIEVFNNDAAILKGILAGIAATQVDAVNAMMLTGNYEIIDNQLTIDGEAANPLGRAVVPGILAAGFFMFMMLLGNRFLMAVVEEKENRISEMILTAVSAKHLVIGKIIAMIVLGVVQIAVMAIPAVALIAMNADNEMIASVVGTIEVDPVMTGLLMALFMAAVFFYAGACMYIGSLTSTAKDASSFFGPAVVVMVLPLYFITAFLATEPGMLVYILSYFPLSAPLALMMRSAVGTLPVWELMIGVVEMIVMAVVMTRLAVKTFQKNAVNFDSVRFDLKKLRRK